MQSLFSSIPDLGSKSCKFKVAVDFEKPDRPGAIQDIRDIVPDQWVTIHYTTCGLRLTCQIQNRPDRDGSVKMLPLNDLGIAGQVVEVSLADMGVIPYHIPDSGKRWNQDTYTTPAEIPC